MRIVHTCLRYPPAIGGVETYVQRLVEETRNIDEKRDVRVLTSKMRTHAPISELEPESLLDNPPYVQRLHHVATPGLAYPRLQALDYYLGHHKPDILHGYSFWYQPADVAARYAKKHHVPFIFHPIYYENEVRQKIQWQIYKQTIGRKTFALADIVAVISPYEQELIERAGYPVKRFLLLPPGVDVVPESDNVNNPFNEWQIKGTVILAVGRIAAGKGLADVVAAMPVLLREVPDVQLALVGEDFGALADLQRQAHELDVADHVHFLGRLSDSDLRAAYQHADIFVHPTHYEAFGIVMAEALAAGTPVVARRVAAVSYVVPDRQAGILFNSPDELVAALLELLKLPHLRRKFGEAGKEHVRKNFSWIETTRKLLALYDELKPNYRA